MLDLRDFGHGVLAATFTGAAPVAVLYGIPENWSDLPLGSKLRWLALLGVGVMLVSQLTALLPV